MAHVATASDDEAALLGRARHRKQLRPGEIVLDLFHGSGTTLIAAERTGRTCYGLEIDPHYCAVAIARWEALTGSVAVKFPAIDLAAADVAGGR